MYIHKDVKVLSTVAINQKVYKHPNLINLINTDTIKQCTIVQPLT